MSQPHSVSPISFSRFLSLMKIGSFGQWDNRSRLHREVVGVGIQGHGVMGVGWGVAVQGTIIGFRVYIMRSVYIFCVVFFIVNIFVYILGNVERVFLKG